MGYTYQETITTTVVNAAPVTTAETIIGALTVPTNLFRDNGIKLDAEIPMTTGTAVTAVQVRIRRGTTITDPIVQVLNTLQVGASLPTVVGHSVFDALIGEQASINYVV